MAGVEQGDTGDASAQPAARDGSPGEVGTRPHVKQGGGRLPRRWVVERSFAWAARFRRLARDYERVPTTRAGSHVLAFAILMLKRFLMWLTHSASQALGK
jgi:transposase